MEVSGTRLKALTLDQAAEIVSERLHAYLANLTADQLAADIKRHQKGFDVISTVAKLNIEVILRVLIGLEDKIHEQLPEEYRELLSSPEGRRWLRIRFPEFCR